MQNECKISRKEIEKVSVELKATCCMRSRSTGAASGRAVRSSQELGIDLQVTFWCPMTDLLASEAD